MMRDSANNKPVGDCAPRLRRWCINGRFLGRDSTGVDRYAFEILRSMDVLIGNDHPLTAGLALEVLCAPRTAKVSPFFNIPLRSLPGASGYLWEQFVLPRYVSGGLLSFCNTGPLATRKQILCIHDVNTRLVSRSYGLSFRMAYRALQPALARRAARVVTVSRFSQQMIALIGITRAHKIEIIYNGHEHVLRWNAAQSQLNQADLPHPFVLLVGSNAPHKNTAIIYSIAAELARKGIHVVIAGGLDATVYARTRHCQVPTNVRHLGRVGDNDLALLYQRALCLVFPSLTEGFGLPALEAMALGCPVISSDAASLTEVCGGAALYASPHDSSAWLTAIERIAIDAQLRDGLVAEGKQRSQLFSWRRSADQYLKLMFEIDHHDSENRCYKVRQAEQGVQLTLPERAGPSAKAPATVGRSE
jgi:glycosyltransferase involved in cell wall biosynthesis